MKNKYCEEYLLLTDMLEEVSWAIEGSCNDIDCDKYTYKNLLKKKYKPVLEHNSSCMSHLKTQKEALLRLLSMGKFKRFRYKKCEVCKKQLDKLSEDYTIVSFTRPSKIGFEYKGISVHKKCSKNVKNIEGWKKGF